MTTLTDVSYTKFAGAAKSSNTRHATIVSSEFNVSGVDFTTAFSETSFSAAANDCTALNFWEHPSSSNISFTGSKSYTTASITMKDSFQETYYQASLAVWIYVPPFLLVLGTVGNILTIWLLSDASKKSSSAILIYFRALAISDLCLLYSGLLRNWIKYLFKVEIRDMHSVVCKIHIWIVYVTGMTSAWFLVAMTSQRALSVVWPHKIGVMCTRKTATVLIAVIVVLSCALNAHNLYGYDLKFYKDYGQYFCDYLNKEYETFVRGPWPWFDLTVNSVLPFLLLIANNSLLMWKIASSVGDVKNLTSSNNTQEVVSQRKKMSTSLNLTLICLSAMFLLLTSPICVYLVLDHYFHYDLHNNPATDLAWAVTNNLWYANSAINFYLYCLSGSKFRRQVWKQMCCWRISRNKGTTQRLNTVSGLVTARSLKDGHVSQTSDF